MPMETRSSSALFKRAEQLKRWEESETNREEPVLSDSKPTRIKFSDGCVFLAACAAGDKDEVERLVSLGADINTANVDGLTALHQACIDDNLDMVEFLVEHQCDLNRGDNEGWTPLHATASCGFVSIARYLIEMGADVAAVNNDGDLPIDIGESGEIEELLQAEIDRLAIDCDAVRMEEERVMLEHANQWLNLKKTEDIVHPKTGATSLHVAAAKGYFKVMSILIQAGADLNQQDNDGWTPMHAAAHWGQREACEILAENLTNMDIQNFAGQTCFDVADADLVKVLEELKKKQASMCQEKPEIQEILQRKAPPPLKRRTSVTRMSGADKSNVVMKDSFAERAQIEKTLRLDEEEEEVEKNEANRLDRIPEVEIPVIPKEVIQPILEDTIIIETPQPAPVLIPNTQEEPKNVEETRSWRRLRREDSDVVEPPPKIVEPPKNPVNEEEAKEDVTEAITLKIDTEISSRFSSDDNDANGSPIDDAPYLAGQIRRVFIPPARDDESEAQRKAHAKRVRETRRSTQGVTLEDLKSAEQQLLRKQQEEDERKEQEKDSAKTPQSLKSKNDKIVKLEEQIKAVISAPSPSAASSSSSSTTTTTSSSERKQPRKLRGDFSEPEGVVLRKPLSDLNAPTPVTTAPVVTDTTTGSSTVTAPPRVRQRPLSAPPETPDVGTSVTIPLRLKIKQDLINNEDEKGDKEKSGDEKTQLGTQSAIQRRKRPKRRSTGVVFLDGDVPVANEIITNNGEDNGNCLQVQNEDSASDRFRNKATRTLQDGRDNTPSSRLADRSRTTSLNSSTSSLNEDTEKDYKKLYTEVKDENDRLKIKLKQTEDDLESAKRQLDKILQNNKNSLSDAEKRERRALERRLSEMEEESKTIANLTAVNLKLKDENTALNRVVSNLSK